MSNYNGRSAPNVSQYVHNLNAPPTAQELAAQQHDLDLAAAGELDFLINTDFVDFDQFAHGPTFEDTTKPGQQYPFDQFTGFPNTAVNSPSTIASPQDGLHGAYPAQPQHFGISPTTGDKRKASVALPGVEQFEEGSRAAAEEDKRRRNTAASARFRVKKKQREQALEKQTKDMSDKVAMLENKVSQLEQENTWLKGLIKVNSGDGKALDTTLEARLQKETEERSTGNRTDGVGTPVEAK